MRPTTEDGACATGPGSRRPLRGTQSPNVWCLTPNRRPTLAPPAPAAAAAAADAGVGEFAVQVDGDGLSRPLDAFVARFSACSR